MYKLTKNGKEVRQKTSSNSYLNRADCLIKLEKARSKAVIAGYTFTWKGDTNGALMVISNGETWKMERIA